MPGCCQPHDVLFRCLYPHLGPAKKIEKSTYTQHNQWFHGLQARYSASFKMSPQQCRHLFVDERMGENAVAGPSPEAAAIVMGNSTESKYCNLLYMLMPLESC